MSLNIKDYRKIIAIPKIIGGLQNIDNLYDNRSNLKYVKSLSIIVMSYIAEP
jgi:hypothetical protein